LLSHGNIYALTLMYSAVHDSQGGLTLTGMGSGQRLLYFSLLLVIFAVAINNFLHFCRKPSAAYSSSHLLSTAFLFG
jgi:hypothetical protein